MTLRLQRNLVLLFVLVVQASTQAARPNVLIVTIDDMSCDSVGVFGSKLAEATPNMDDFARTAMRFRYAHVQVGNCMPSRNVMWSGRFPHNNGVEGFYKVDKPSYPVLCDLAKQAGYFTAIRHKVSHSTPYSPYAWDQVLDSDEAGNALHVKDAASYGASTRRGIQSAVAEGKPFCLLINVADPHKPFYSEVKKGDDPHIPSRVFTADEVPVPGFLPDDGVIRAELARYYSSVRRADDAVGFILNALKESGQAENTFVLFLADHGMPLPFAKTQVYHNSTRTPLMVRWPAVTQPGFEDTVHMVSAVDFLPTLLDVIGAPAPSGMDGRSFAPVLRGGTQKDRDFVVKEYNENSGAKRNPMRAIETRQYLYIFNPWSNGELKMATATNGTDTYKRMKVLATTDSDIAKRLNVADFRSLEELYDVKSDPDCLNNLVNRPGMKDVVKRLQGQLLYHMQKTGDPVAEVLAHKKDADFVARYMERVQKEADQRRSAKRKSRPRTPPKRKRNIITLDSSSVTREGGKLIVAISHKVPRALDTQLLTVTLKGKDGKRIERKHASISGAGTAQIAFDLQSAIREPQVSEQLSVAAFVGEDYASNIQHVQIKID